MKYKQMLKDPRWQKKRLEVFERAGWKCESCGDGTTELHVHHVEYKKGAKPWEYSMNDLQCLCKHCHKKDHKKTVTKSTNQPHACFECTNFIHMDISHSQENECKISMRKPVFDTYEHYECSSFVFNENNFPRF